MQTSLQSLHGIGPGLARDIVQLWEDVAKAQGRDLEWYDLLKIPAKRISLAVWKENFKENLLSLDELLRLPT